MKPRVFVTRELPGDPTPRLREVADVEVWPDAEPPPHDEIVRRTADADALLTMLTDRIDADVLDAGKRLRVVAQMAVGYDNVDVAAATERGILVTNTPGVLTETTADLAFALLLAAARRTLVRPIEYPPEIDVEGQPPRIGVFVCHCGSNIAGVVDVAAVT